MPSFSGKDRTCVEQGLDGRRILSLFSIPPVLGSVNGPSLWNPLKLIVGVLREWGVAMQNQPNQLRIPVSTNGDDHDIDELIAASPLLLGFFS